jgi:hypothetical protein
MPSSVFHPSVPSQSPLQSLPGLFFPGRTLSWSLDPIPFPFCTPRPVLLRPPGGHRPVPDMESSEASGATNTVAAALQELIVTFNDLNGQNLDELDEEPSPLEFMRYVARNTPFVIRGAASTWRAGQRWNAEYLKSALGGQTVNVAVTPIGSAY